MRGLFRVRRRRALSLWMGLPFALVVTLPWMFSQKQLFYEKLLHVIEQEGTQAFGLEVEIQSLQTTPWGEGIFQDLSLSTPEGRTLLLIRELRIPFEMGHWIRRSPAPHLHLRFREGEFQKGSLQLTALEGDLFFLTASLSKPVFSHGSIQGRWALFQRRGMFQLTFRRTNPFWLEGKLWLEGGQPFGSLSALVLSDQDRVSLREVTWDKSLRLSGTISRKPPYPVELHVHLDLSRETLVLLGQGTHKELPGRFQGWIDLDGLLQRPHLEGRFEAREGTVRGAPYQLIQGTLYGTWPYATVESEVNHGPSGGFSFAQGLLDLESLGQEGWYKTVDLEPTHEAAFWKELEFRAPTEDSLTIGKNSPRQSVRLKTYLGGDDSWKEEDTFEWEYQLPSKKLLKIRLEEKDSFLGLGQRVQF